MMGNETKQTRRGPINSRGQAESAAACATNSRNRMGKLPWKVSGMGENLKPGTRRGRSWTNRRWSGHERGGWRGNSTSVDEIVEYILQLCSDSSEIFALSGTIVVKPNIQSFLNIFNSKTSRIFISSFTK